jgi:hypothetical protein
VRAGRTLGPVPPLGAAYRRLAQMEHEAMAVMEDLVRRHPAWPWWSGVRGVGASLAARLLARLDLAR